MVSLARIFFQFKKIPTVLLCFWNTLAVSCTYLLSNQERLSEQFLRKCHSWIKTVVYRKPFSSLNSLWQMGCCASQRVLKTMRMIACQSTFRTSWRLIVTSILTKNRQNLNSEKMGVHYHMFSPSLNEISPYPLIDTRVNGSDDMDCYREMFGQSRKTIFDECSFILFRSTNVKNHQCHLGQDMFHCIRPLERLETDRKSTPIVVYRWIGYWVVH